MQSKQTWGNICSDLLPIQHTPHIICGFTQGRIHPLLKRQNHFKAVNVSREKENTEPKRVQDKEGWERERTKSTTQKPLEIKPPPGQVG